MAEQKVIKFKSPYSFKDAKEEAIKANITLDEMVFNLESKLDHERAGVSLYDATVELHDALLNESNFKDGVDEQFARNGYTVLDLNLRRPAFNSFAFKHVPHIYGGGAVETDKGFFVKPITRQGRLASGNNNKVNLVGDASETLEAPILPITLGLSIGYIDQLKADTIGYDKIGVQHEAVRMSYELEKDAFAFVGHRGIDGTNTDGAGMARGLINFSSDDAVISDLETKVYDTPITNKTFQTMNTRELISVITQEYVEFIKQVSFDASFAPNKWLVSPEILASLSQPAYLSVAGTVYQSQLEYVNKTLEVLRKTYGAPEIWIEQLPYLAPYTAQSQFAEYMHEDGTNNNGRTVMYRQDPYIMRSRLALDLTPGALVYDVVNNVFRRNYIAFLGTPLLYYPKQIRYIDNGAVASAE